MKQPKIIIAGIGPGNKQDIDTFRTELQNVLDYGEEYLALQSAAGSKHAAKSFGHPGDGE